jgi:hypothetical protein
MVTEVEYFSGEEEENIEKFEKKEIINTYDNFENEIKPIINHIALKKTVIRPENIKGYTIAYIDSVLISVSNRGNRSEIEGLVYAVLDDPELFDFFNTQEPPIDKGYTEWDCPEMEKIRDFPETYNHTGLSFALLCRNVQLFFREPQKFFDTFVKF